MPRAVGDQVGVSMTRDGINNILPDDGRFDAWMMWLRVREKGSPRTMTSGMITSSDMESETRKPDD